MTTIYSLDFSTPSRSLRLFFATEKIAIAFSRQLCAEVSPEALPYLRFHINPVPVYDHAPGQDLMLPGPDLSSVRPDSRAQLQATAWV
jgi:hypothetical protein